LSVNSLSPRERVGVTTAWMQEVEQRMEQLPRGSSKGNAFFIYPLILTFSLKEKE